MTVAPPRRRLLRRLVVGQLLVVLAGAATLVVVAVLVAPPIFRDHVRRGMGPVSDVVAGHLDTALGETLTLSLVLGVGASVLAAVGVSWLLATRLARPVEDLSRTAAHLAAGRLDARATGPVTDDELADLTRAFNEMADALEHTDHTRRRLLADLAHELRTPLATIEAYHEGLADGVVEPDGDTTAVLAEATGRLRRLIEDVGVLSEAEEGRLSLDLQPHDVGEVVAAAVAAVRPAAEQAGVNLRVERPDAPVRAHADRDRLGQVLGNLLGNALAHTPPGGTVSVAVADRGDVATVTVADTGAGIAPEHLAHVFDRFYRADPARHRPGGSGLGLTISRALVTQQGGTLTAASDGPGHGATFTVVLPGLPS